MLANSMVNVAFMGLCFISFASDACDKEFPASEFLDASHRFGKQLKHDCHLVDLPSNKFHAPPDSSCTVTFDSGVWFRNDWKFKSIKGNGAFQINKTSTGLEIKIDKKGGFHLRSVVVDITSDNCSNISIEDGL